MPPPAGYIRIPNIATQRTLFKSDDFIEIDSASLGSARTPAQNFMVRRDSVANIKATDITNVGTAGCLMVPPPFGPYVYNSRLYYYNAGSSAVPDDFTVLLPNSAPATGRWTLIPPELTGASKQGVPLHNVAFSGAYSDLAGTPVIPPAPVQANWNEANAGSPAYIQNKPSIGAAQIQSDWNQGDNTQKDFIKNKPVIPTGFGVARVFNIEDYGARIVGGGVTDVDNATYINACLAAANAVHGEVVIPPGVYAVNGVLAVHLTAGLTVRGYGRGVSIIQQNGAVGGMAFDCSGSEETNVDAGLRVLTIDGVTVRSNNSSPGIGININYGARYQTSHTNSNGFLHNLECLGFQTGLMISSAWNYTIDNVNCAGSQTNYANATGPGSGPAIYINGCINFTLSNIFQSFHKWGIYIPGTNGAFIGPDQGINITNLLQVQCVYGIDIRNALAVYVTSWLCDNGNIEQAAHLSLYLNNVATAVFTNGQILQRGGAHQAWIYNSREVCLVGIDFVYRAVTGAAVKFSNGSFNSLCNGCLYGSVPLEVDATCYGIKNKNATNRGAFLSTDNAPDGQNEIGDQKLFQNAFVIPASPGASHTVQFNISPCGLGRRGTGNAQVVSAAGNVQARYDWDNSTSSVANVILYTVNGAPLTANAAYRVSILVGPVGVN